MNGKRETNNVIDYISVREKWLEKEKQFKALTGKRAKMLTKLDEWYKQEQCIAAYYLSLQGVQK